MNMGRWEDMGEHKRKKDGKSGEHFKFFSCINIVYIYFLQLTSEPLSCLLTHTHFV